MKYKCKKCGTEFEVTMTAKCPKCGEMMDIEPIYNYKVSSVIKH